MEELEVKCPGCRQTLVVPPELSGQMANCPSCNESVQLPYFIDDPAESRPQTATNDTVGRKQVVYRKTQAVKPPPREEIPAGTLRSRSKLSIPQGLVLAGSLLVLIGLFLPFVRVHEYHSPGMFDIHRYKALLCVVLAVAAMVAIRHGWNFLYYYAALGCAGVILGTLGWLKYSLKYDVARVANDVDFATGLAALIARGFQPSWGSFVILLGAGLVSVSIFLKGPDPDNRYAVCFIIPVGLRIAAGCIIGAAVLFVSYLYFTGNNILADQESSARKVEPYFMEVEEPDSDTSDPDFLQFSKPEKTGEWIVSTDISPIDDSTTYLLMKQAEAPIGSGFMSAVPSLMIRHKEGVLETFVIIGSYLGSGDFIEVLTRVGKNRPEVLEWGLSNTGKAIFYPGNHGQFVRRLLNNESLVVRLDTMMRGEVTCVFEIDELAEVLRGIGTLKYLAE